MAVEGRSDEAAHHFERSAALAHELGRVPLAARATESLADVGTGRQ